jgi:hypothetical protein
MMEPVKIGGLWCIMASMSTAPSATAIRRTVTIPADLFAKVDAIAASRHVTANRAFVDLLADGIAAYERRRANFIDLAQRFQRSTDEGETEKRRQDLLRMTFGA